jgi:hypothetical protein
MRKKLLGSAERPDISSERWLEVGELATVELTSEDPNFPIESALVPGRGPGWRAAQSGMQIIRVVFDRPRPLQRIRLEFSETELERTQEFSLEWSVKANGPFTEIARQQWNFSPRGSTSEIEDYRVNLASVSTLQLTLKPDLTRSNAIASLAAWRIA